MEVSTSSVPAKLNGPFLSILGLEVPEYLSRFGFLHPSVAPALFFKK